MENIDCDSWEDFEINISKLRDQFGPDAGFLYRGQRDASWNLETTLDRSIGSPSTVARYYRLASVARPQVETFSDSRWETPSFEEMQAWVTDYDSMTLKNLPAYDYFVYLRHHGFPSPLLDWTQSQYVAAFFALSGTQSDRAAIYVYLEYVSGGKTFSSGEPQIVKFGPYVRSHSRHFLQQSQYTISCIFNEGEWWFAPHEDFFASGTEDQDRLWKFSLPTSERIKVLKLLDAHNLNAFSLFQTDEALLETIAMRQIEF